MSDKLLVNLDHINIPAIKPEWLAEWYAEKFGFVAQSGFVSGAGFLLVFEKGEPLDYKGKVHFGFRCSCRETVKRWATDLNAILVENKNYNGFKASDPEGNIFEVYWED